MFNRNRIIAFLLIASLLFTSSAVFAAPRYIDTSGHWGDDAIQFWSANEVVIGYPDASFKPDNYVTRAEVAQVIVNLLRLDTSAAADISNPFSDISQTDWFYSAVLTCVDSGYIMGFDDGTMHPDDSIIREQAITIIARAMCVNPAEASKIEFPDAYMMSNWAKEEIFGMVNVGLVRGYEDGELKPLRIMTRAELVMILRRAIALYAYHDGAVYQAPGGAGGAGNDGGVGGITLVVAKGVTIRGAVNTLLVGGGAKGGETHVREATVDNAVVAADDCVVYIYPDTNINRNNVIITGENSTVIYIDSLDEDSELPLGPATPAPTPAPARTAAPSTAAPGGGGGTGIGGGGGAAATYTVGLSIQETTPGSAFDLISSNNISYIASSVLIADVFTQLSASTILEFRNTFKDTYANAIMQEGIMAYISGATAWTAYVDKYISDVSETSSSSISIKTALRNNYTIMGVGTGRWAMVYNVQQGAQADAAGNPVYRQYTVTIAIT